MNLTKSQTAILNVLKRTNRNITPQTLAKRSKVASVSQRIAELRQNGYPNIYTNVIRVNGRKTSAYRLGEPTKAMKRAARAGNLTIAK